MEIIFLSVLVRRLWIRYSPKKRNMVRLKRVGDVDEQARHRDRLGLSSRSAGQDVGQHVSLELSMVVSNNV